MSRRGFLQGCTAALALSMLKPGPAATPADVLVVISLRGGWDSLSAFVPQDDPIYHAARPNLAVTEALDFSRHLGLHPALAPLLEIYQASRLAVVPSAGLFQESRSHFQATAWMEGGRPGRAAASGWLSRWLHQLELEPGGFPALSLGFPSQSLQGFPRTVALDDLDELSFRLLREDLAPSLLDEPSRHALEALTLARRVAERPECSEVEYPDTDFGWQLSEAARMIRCPELGVRVVTLELEGWDTHSDQCDVLESLFTDLSEGLRAFSEDTANSPVTTVVMSEFGRTVAENASLGTDHGRGSAMLVMGDGVRGGLYGPWPGLEGREDLEVTVDYRSVLGELLTQRLGCARLQAVFPDWDDYRPLGLASPKRP